MPKKLHSCHSEGAKRPWEFFAPEERLRNNRKRLPRAAGGSRNDGNRAFGCRSFPRFHPACSVKNAAARSRDNGRSPSCPNKKNAVQTGGSEAVARRVNTGACTDRSLSACSENRRFSSSKPLCAPNIALFYAVVKWFLLRLIMLTDL